MPVRKNIKRIISFIGFILLFVTVDQFYTRDHVFLSAKSPDNRYVAELAWRRNWGGTIAVFLLIKEIKGENLNMWGYLPIMSCQLIGGRNSYAEAELEFQGLSWDGNVLTLILNRWHYRGPSSFKIADPNF